MRFISDLPRLVSLSLLLVGMAILSSNATQAIAQGCVIARGGSCSLQLGDGGFLTPGDWQLSIAYRYFHSDRHFHGTEEQTHRKELGTQVDNWSHFTDLTANYAINRRLWLNFTVPFVRHSRSSLYEHFNYGRFTTRSSGLGDMLFGASYWIFDPETTSRGNLSLGVSVKAPTGDYRATDTFRAADGGLITRSVDSSIQPGDGGWGLNLQVQSFWTIRGLLTGYFDGSYLINPRESTRQLDPRQNAAYGDLFSVPDAYTARLGLDYVVWIEQGISMSLGGRIEGVPPKDLIGGNQGRRRPGYAVSIEPGISWSKDALFASLTVPVAVKRNRQPDYGRLNGQRAAGDAAFADYTTNLTLSLRF